MKVLRLTSLSVLDRGREDRAAVAVVSARVGVGGLTGPMSRTVPIELALELRFEGAGWDCGLVLGMRFAVMGVVCAGRCVLSRFAAAGGVVREGLPCPRVLAGPTERLLATAGVV